MTISMGTANMDEIKMCTALLQQILEEHAIEVIHKSIAGDLGYRWEFKRTIPYSQINGSLTLSASEIVLLRGMSERDLCAFFSSKLKGIGAIESEPAVKGDDEASTHPQHPS